MQIHMFHFSSKRTHLAFMKMLIIQCWLNQVLPQQCGLSKCLTKNSTANGVKLRWRHDVFCFQATERQTCIQHQQVPAFFRLPSCGLEYVLSARSCLRWVSHMNWKTITHKSVGINKKKTLFTFHVDSVKSPQVSLVKMTAETWDRIYFTCLIVQTWDVFQWVIRIQSINQEA